MDEQKQLKCFKLSHFLQNNCNLIFSFVQSLKVGRKKIKIIICQLRVFVNIQTELPPQKKNSMGAVTEQTFMSCLGAPPWVDTGVGMGGGGYFWRCCSPKGCQVPLNRSMAP